MSERTATDEITGKKWGRMYVFDKYLKVFEKP